MLVPERFVPKKSSKDKLSAVLGLLTALLAIVGLGNGSGGDVVGTSVPIHDGDGGTTRGTIAIRSLKGLQQHQSTPLLKLQGVHRSIGQRVLFDNVTITVHAGDLVFVNGPSGAGKSQLMRIIAGLTPMDPPKDQDVGSMALAGRGWEQHQNSMGQTTPAHWRRHVRYVPQSKVQVPGTPREFIHRIASFRSWKQQRQACHHRMEGQQQHEDCPPTAEEMIAITATYLGQWGLRPPVDSFLDQEWSHLSGGEAQRMILAISLSSRPRVLLVDECTSALDGDSKQAVEQSIVEELRRQRQKRANEDVGMGVVWISHDDKQVEWMTSALEGEFTDVQGA